MATPEDLLTSHILTNSPATPVADSSTAVRRRAKKTTAPDVDYGVVAMTVAEWGEVGFWASVWVLDAWFTVTFLQTAFGVAFGIGIIVHVVASAIQNHLWRLGWRDHLVPVTVIAVANIGTSILGLWALLGRWFSQRPFDVFGRIIAVPAALPLFYSAAAAAILIALMPEPRLAKYIRRLLGR